MIKSIIIKSFVILLIIVVNACSTIKVAKVKSNQEIKKTGFVYALPKSKINIEFKILKTKFFKGPFSDYAKEYLGIENVIESNKNDYKFLEISVKNEPIIDSSYIFNVSSADKIIKSFSYYPNTLILESINSQTAKTSEKIIKQEFFYDKTEQETIIPFKDRTIKPLVVEKSDTIWKNILVDSVYKRVPKINRAIAPRTIKDQAYLASRFIFKVRKRRLRVLAGMDEKFPPGKSVKTIIKELNKLEQSYIELFTGKTISDTLYFSYSLTPEKNNDELIIKYDKNTGFSKDARKIMKIMIEKSDYLEKLNTLSNKEKKMFAYKIPGEGKLTIEFDGNKIFEKTIAVSQYGYINFLNNKTLQNKIKFDENGNILYIKTK